MPTEDRYIVEIYYPGSRDAVEAVFHSPLPFGTISVGDSLETVGFDGAPLGSRQQRVTKVAHILWGVDGTAKHKILVFTEESE